MSETKSPTDSETVESLSDVEQVRAERSERVDSVLQEVHELQDTIFDCEDKISNLVETFGPDPILLALVEQGNDDRQLRHLVHLKNDWDTLLIRSRAATEDDIELVAALVRFVGDLLSVQPENLEERFLESLTERLETLRGQVN